MVVVVVVVVADADIQLLYRLWISNVVALIKRSVQKALSFVVVVVRYGDILFRLPPVRVACSCVEEEAAGEAYATTSSTRIGPNWLILSEGSPRFASSSGKPRLGEVVVAGALFSASCVAVLLLLYPLMLLLLLKINSSAHFDESDSFGANNVMSEEWSWGGEEAH